VGGRIPSPIELKKNDIVAIGCGEGRTLEIERTPSLFKVVRDEREGNKWAIGEWKMEPEKRGD